MPAAGRYLVKCGAWPVTKLVDSYGRVTRKLRISVTDRCNFRCQFCMPTEPVWLPRNEILTFEEIRRVALILSNMGVRKIRLSGGEPLMRSHIEKLVEMLAEISTIEDISMTTNGFLLEEKAAALQKAGLRGVTVSVHSLKPAQFGQISGGGELGKVLAGLKAAKKNDLKLKINAVIIRGCNEDEISDLAGFAAADDITVRFIEYMPFDGQRMWGTDKVVSGKEILKRIQEHYELIALPREDGSTARNFRFAKSEGQIGLVTSITQPFCADCDRIRISADGKIVPCLFDKTGFDIKHLLRSDASDDELSMFIRDAMSRKAPGVETLLKEFTQLKHVRPMHTIGG